MTFSADEMRRGRARPPDEHLAPPPPPGPVDHLVVVRAAGHHLIGPLRERVGAGAHQVHPERVRGGPQQIERLGQVVDGLGYRVVHVGDQLDGVAQEFLGQSRSMPGPGLDRVEDDRSGVRQIPRRLVDQRDLPLHAEGGSRRTGELNRHTPPNPTTAPGDRHSVAGAL